MAFIGLYLAGIFIWIIVDDHPSIGIQNSKSGNTFSTDDSRNFSRNFYIVIEAVSPRNTSFFNPHDSIGYLFEVLWKDEMAHRLLGHFPITIIYNHRADAFDQSLFERPGCHFISI
jgi:hypothetical protein